ncbi:MAG: pyridoxine kinase [Rhodospirillaceae bacterium]|jgi:pyridoxine kinase|nr:pyridoxine kinase [Rhodospirillaceae bacterium]
MNILSLQSRVAYGHVGNSAAVPALQSLGHQTWPVDTTLLSNHLGYQTHSGRILPAEEVAAVLEGLAQIDVLAECDALLSGFLGHSAEIAAAAAGRLRAANPAALYCLDPVMGERNGGFYVRPAIAETIATRLLPLADIVTPNAFELDQLAGARTVSLADVAEAADKLRRLARPGAIVVATGIGREDGPADRVEVLAAAESGIWLGEVPRLVVPAHGGGDIFAALFLGHYLHRRDLPAALQRAMDSTHAVFSASVGRLELALTATLRELADPPKAAVVRKIR